MTVASPDGGRVEFDAYSDPRDPSNSSAEDSSDGLHHAGAAGALREHRRLADLDLDHYDAHVAGGQSPMFSSRARRRRRRGAIAPSTRPRSPPPSAVTATAALVDVKLADGSYLVTGTHRHRLRQRGGGRRRRVVGRRSCPGASRTPCASAAPTTSMAACSRRSPCATGGSSPASSSTRAEGRADGHRGPGGVKHAHRRHRRGTYRRQRRAALREGRPRGARQLLARPAKLEALAAEIGGRAGTPREAVAFGEVVMLSVSWTLIDDVLAQAGPLDGKIVIDTTNQFGRGGWEDLGGARPPRSTPRGCRARATRRRSTR